MRFFVSVLLALSFLLSCASPIVATPAAEQDLTDGIIAWVRAQGGYWNDKVQIRRVTIPDTTISYLGVFAHDALLANEKVMNIPKSCYIHVWDAALGMQEDVDARSFRNYHANICLLSQKMQHELQLGDQSAYAPYVAYLQHQTPGQVPATWSEAGKALLRQIVPPQSDVVDWMDMYYRGSDSEESVECLPSPPSVEQDHFLAMTVQRCFDTALIPLWDMVNHDNGNINTNHTSIYADEGVTIWTSEAVPAGGELLASYDGCLDCFGIDDYWGTPEILRDFGFVERSSQRWIFLEQEIWFELYTHEENGTRTTTTVHWDDDAIYADEEEESPIYWGVPNVTGTAFLRSELDRLRTLDDSFASTSTIPSAELGTIVQFRDAAINALSLAIESATQRQLSDPTCANLES